MRSVFAGLLAAMERGRDTVLATIVRAAGSTPRGFGAQMLVDADGLLCGTIGGGSVEGESIVFARSLLPQKHSAVRDYRLRTDIADSIGMVCGGDVTVHFQYVAARDGDWHALALDILRRIDSRIPATLVLSPNGDTPCLLSAEEQIPESGYALQLPVGERAVIFGAGHCSVALSPILQTVGFRVTVLDDRPELADPSRFPGADAVICGSYDKLSDYLTVSADDYLVVMTSGHTHDFTVENQLLRGKFAYLGVIGSRGKTAAVNEMLRSAGIPETALTAVHTPIGTPIKAVTPEEIAVSIAGEMIRVRAERRERSGALPHGCPMHE